MKGKAKHRPGEIDALYFDKMPPRCKEMFFEYMNNPDIEDHTKVTFCNIGTFYYEFAESPIEAIFNFAFDLSTIGRENRRSDIYLISQEDIKIGNKTYRADFLFSTDECESPYAHFEKNYKLVIECDGHEFHEKTKAQVKKDNERDMALKMAGYDVLHFSGSQIYNEPFKCAEQVIEYILSKI